MSYSKTVRINGDMEVTTHVWFGSAMSHITIGSPLLPLPPLGSYVPVDLAPMFGRILDRERDRAARQRRARGAWGLYAAGAL